MNLKNETQLTPRQAAGIKGCSVMTIYNNKTCFNYSSDGKRILNDNLFKKWKPVKSMSRPKVK